MKTNQQLVVKLRAGEITIGHLDLMGDLSALFVTGNYMRQQSGKPALAMQKYMQLESTKEFLAQVESELGHPAIASKSGRGGYTRAHLYVLIDAAAYMDATLKLEIMKVFVHGQLLRFRDDSGDEFKSMNTALSEKASELLGKEAHAGHYVTLAKIIRGRILDDDHPGWNYATGEQLRQRVRLEEKISDFISAGVVRDWEHLKELAEKI